MQKQAPKILVIMGPTASGKSGVAIEIAKKFNGEIISADSRQVYRKMDIGTGKVPKDKSSSQGKYLSEGVIHHLIDVAEPNEDFNVSHFKKIAEEKIQAILLKGKLPIICGGTAFWIDTLTNNSDLPAVAPDNELRAKLAQKSAEELFLQLQQLDSVRAKNIDRKNKVRLIRAIEICLAIGKVPTPETLRLNQETKNAKYTFLQIGITTKREDLNEKIKLRLAERFAQGMIQEVENLHNEGISWGKMEGFGLEYRNIAEFLQGKMELEEMKQRLYFDIVHYAKRQMTWLKRNREIIWLSDYCDIEKEVIKFLQN